MTIQHSRGEYEISATTLARAAESLPTDVRIITDKTVAGVVSTVLAGRQYFAIEPGESSKCLDAFGKILSWLASTNASRKTTVVAIGGGVVGDLAGFVAASYMRGIPFIQIPTTLLSMIDSSVGGKVGIDLPEGKNLAGAFKPPDAVLVPIDLLQTLPTRQFRNGMAEALKTGFIMDEQLSARLRREVLTSESSDLEAVVLRCIELKAQVVREDEFETNGIRATLNFGHTIGHSIEHAFGYDGLLHGEAISIGMVLEAKLGENLGITEPGTARVVAEDLALYGLPTRLETHAKPAELLQTMYRDKKASAGSLAFSLLTAIGRCKLIRDVPPDAVLEALEKG